MNTTRPTWLNKGSTHYKGFKIEPLEFIMANNLPFWMGNVIKYVMRADMKDGIDDLKKAKHYIEVKIEELERAEKPPETNATLYGKEVYIEDKDIKWYGPKKTKMVNLELEYFEDCGFKYARKGKPAL